MIIQYNDIEPRAIFNNLICLNQIRGIKDLNGSSDHVIHSEGILLFDFIFFYFGQNVLNILFLIIFYFEIRVSQNVLKFNLKVPVML